MLGKSSVGKCGQQRVLCLVRHNHPKQCARIYVSSAMHQRQNRNVAAAHAFFKYDAFLYIVCFFSSPSAPHHVLWIARFWPARNQRVSVCGCDRYRACFFNQTTRFQTHNCISELFDVFYELHSTCYMLKYDYETENIRFEWIHVICNELQKLLVFFVFCIFVEWKLCIFGMKRNRKISSHEKDHTSESERVSCSNFF